MKSSLAILAAASIPLLLSAPRASAGEVNWSAKIGTGHTSSGRYFALPRAPGVPASPHWTASIGTGQAANAANESPRGPAKLARASVFTSTGAHWTSKIGTGRASGSNAETIKRRIQS